MCVGLWDRTLRRRRLWRRVGHRTRRGARGNLGARCPRRSPLRVAIGSARATLRRSNPPRRRQLAKVRPNFLGALVSWQAGPRRNAVLG
eukprot:861505-Pyramimonas_sp.AAC.2